VASRYRWAILAAGTFGQASYVSLFLGLTVLAPTLRAGFDLSLTQVGLVLAAPTLGSIATLYPWGLATDRVGERIVLSVGLAVASVCTALAAYASSFAALVGLLVLAGAFGASVNSASGRAVMHWFDVRGRGLALGIRQSAVPIAGALVAVVLPRLTTGNDAKPALLTLAAVSAAGAIIGALVLRDRPGPKPDGATAKLAPLRDRRIWMISAASGLLIEPQTCLVGFLVLFLHEYRGMSTTAAAAILAVLNVLGIGTRIGAGRWSDIVASRLSPLRKIGVASAVLVALCAALVSAPLGVLVPLLVLMGCVTISWNGLSFAATAEAAGAARAGTALGIQQTMLAVSGTVYPITFGWFVSESSWRAGFAVSAFFPIAGWQLLRAVRMSS
jgi:sugar phosphate permease